MESANDNVAVGGCPKGQQNKTDVIELAAEEYLLDIPTNDDEQNQNGDLDIGSGGNVTLRGEGADATRIRTDLDDRVIEYNGFEAQLTLQNLEVSGGFSADNTPATGGNIHMTQGKLVMKNASSDNSFGESGGAISLENGTSGVLKNTSITGAGAETTGGAIVVRHGGKLTVRRGTFANNEVDADGPASGGAIRNFEGNVKISDSTFFDNTVISAGAGNNALGGAIYAGNKVVINRTLFNANAATGPLATAQVAGGAIYHVTDEDSKIVNSTFFDNDAGGAGGAVYTNADGLDIVHSSFLFNDADDGGHLYEANLGDLTIANSILASPTLGTSCGALTGKIKSRGYNVFDDDDPECPARAKDRVVNDVGFDSGSVQDNGGPTGTLSLAKSSKAVDLVPLGECEKTDQRGFDRPKGPKCDAGAVERGAKP